jgi:hypothetical protein
MFDVLTWQQGVALCCVPVAIYLAAVCIAAMFGDRP